MSSKIDPNFLFGKFVDIIPKNDIENRMRALVGAKWLFFIRRKYSVLFMNLVIDTKLGNSNNYCINTGGVNSYLIFQIFTAFFCVEAMLKIIAMGKEYFKNQWNVFDFIIVLFSIVEIIVSAVFDDATFDGLTILRVLRLMRVRVYMLRYSRILLL